VAGHRRRIDVAQSDLVVPHVPLRFQHAQLRPDGRVAGCAGHRVHDLGGGGAAEPVERVHDLAFALGQVLRAALAGHAIFITPLRL